jgi:hypothetical protein
MDVALAPRHPDRMRDIEAEALIAGFGPRPHHVAGLVAKADDDVARRHLVSRRGIFVSHQLQHEFFSSRISTHRMP